MAGPTNKKTPDTQQASTALPPPKLKQNIHPSSTDPDENAPWSTKDDKIMFKRTGLVAGDLTAPEEFYRFMADEESKRMRFIVKVLSVDDYDLMRVDIGDHMKTSFYADPDSHLYGIDDYDCNDILELRNVKPTFLGNSLCWVFDEYSRAAQFAEDINWNDVLRIARHNNQKRCGSPFPPADQQ